MATVIRVAIAYVVIWAAFRVIGKRELTRMSPVELVFLLLIPQLFSRALTREDYSLTNAIVGETTLLSLVFLSSALSYRSRRAATILLAKPTVLVAHGAFVVPALHEERMSAEDVYDAIQKAGLSRVEQVQWAVLQADGKIAIVPRG
ncbi:MAG TPA: YetF domain-containing protein [Candidatus Elarobacter sp.]|nr:YetF domain-containing protein [Candidatus Elarobacter sp.]